MSTAESKRNRLRVARLVSEAMSPVVLIVFVTLIVALHSAGRVRGLALAWSLSSLLVAFLTDSC